MRLKIGGKCNCAHCQFLTKVIVFLDAQNDDFETFSTFEGDSDFGDATFYGLMDKRATVRVSVHTQQWH